MNVMMLTAGEGTRLRPHTLILPKPAIPFLNIPLYEYPLYFLSSLKIDKVVMNTFHLPDKLKAAVASNTHRFPIRFSDETTLLGSGGGIGQARDHFEGKGDFILMNGDEVIIPDDANAIDKALEVHRKNGSIATLLVIEHKEVGTKFGGVWVNSASEIIGFGKEELKGAAKGLHYIGVAIFSDKIFNFIKPGESNILYDGLTQAISAGHKTHAFPIAAQWFETGNETDFKLATQQCLQILNEHSKASKYLNELLIAKSPNSLFVQKGDRIILSDKNVKYEIDKLTGYNVFGPGVQLNRDSRLKNCILGPRVRISSAIQFNDLMTFNEQDAF